MNLVLWSGLSYDDAARALGVPVGTVRSRIARARAALGVSLAPLCRYEHEAAAHHKPKESS